MATYNTSEIFAKAWGKAKFGIRESKIRRTFLTGKTLREAFSHFLKEVWTDAKKKAEPVQKFYIALSINEVSLRNQVKSMGGKWDAESKVWTVLAKKSELGLLVERAKKSNELDKAGVNWAGFAGTDRKTLNNIARYGYDAIEM